MKSTTSLLWLASLAGFTAALPAAAPAPIPVGAPAAAGAPPPPLRPRVPNPAQEAGDANAEKKRGLPVSVTYAEATVVGESLLGVESFRGIPFAQPPVGDLRLRPPQRINGSLGTVDAAGIPPSCPQLLLSIESGTPLFNVLGNLLDGPLFQAVSGQTEDCLVLNVQRPAGTAADAKLPVLFWIFGGGFELGSISMYDGTGLVSKGIDIGEPFIFVAVNYRVAGFGFLGGKEILADDAANLGLRDQRMGLQWVADYIEQFGGDPTRVTIWGESAGAISVFDQMALYGGDYTYKGQPLFRGAIMNSGSVVPADPVDSPKAQAIYDRVVAEAGCASASNTLACLRGVDYATLLAAVNSVPGIASYNSVALSYLPRPDGTVLTQSPDVLAASGSFADVPFIIGDQEDEGTLFSILPSNITDTDKLVTYLGSLFFNSASDTQLRALAATYPENPADGSPYGTGFLWELYPGFKRLAAILGDLVFTLTRRVFLTAATAVHPATPVWSYLASYDFGTPFLGTFHGSDLLQVFYGILPNHASNSIQTYYINFVTNQDPNVGAATDLSWPKWTEDRTLLQFFNDRSALLADTFRTASYNYIAGNVASFYI